MVKKGVKRAKIGQKQCVLEVVDFWEERVKTGGKYE